MCSTNTMAESVWGPIWDQRAAVKTAALLYQTDRAVGGQVVDPIFSEMTWYMVLLALYANLYGYVVHSVFSSPW